MIVHAYDANGRHLPHDIAAGDHIDRKRKKTRGTFFCLVLACLDATRRLKITTLRHDGAVCTSCRPVYIGSKGVLAVYDANRNRKAPR